MSDLLQLLTLAKDGELSTRIDNLLAVATAHDAEIKQLQESVNQLIDGGRHIAIYNVALAWVALAGFTAAMILFGWYVSKLDRRIKALESAK